MAERLNFEALWPFKLHRFGTYRGDGPCVMEVVSFLAGGPIDDDTPRCVAEPLLIFIQHVHDAMPDDERQKLLRFVPRLLDSCDFAADLPRVHFLTAEALRSWLPLALKVGGFTHLAGQFTLPVFDLRGYRPVLAEARKVTDDIPLLREAVIRASALVRFGRSAKLAAEVAIAIMEINDPARRRLLLHENEPCCVTEPIELGRVPQIYNAVLRSVHGALRLGSEGSRLDPWVVREAAERFRDAVAKRTSASI
jgi:hypothetical protein